MFTIKNPTGGKLRSDAGGHGAYGASRGTRTHKGKDYEAEPGQYVFSPIDGTVERYARPYKDDENYSGIVIQGKNARVKMFYLNPLESLGAEVKAGQIIGFAQDISAKYGGDMTPHIHLEFVSINPEVLEEKKHESL
jgi:murein DD-endopeptidase MepM/ murein hydrolase activator NlpD